VCQTEDFDLARLRQYAVRPFDNRWCYYSPVRPLWNEPRPSLWAQCWEGNKFLMSRPAGVASPEGKPFHFTTMLGDNDFLRGHAYYFPFDFRHQPAKNGKADKQADMHGQMGGDNIASANLSKEARRYLAGLGIENPDTDADVAGLIWYHALAIGFSPLYLTENADAVRQDWPRIPLPATGEALLASATLGREIGALLDTENPVAGVASGTLRPELKGLGAAARRDGRKKGLSSRDLRLTARWGYAGKKGVTMPGPGSVTERDYGKDEKKALAAGAKALGLKAGEVISLLGEATLDVHLNDAACWRNVPEGVWGYTIGGYQVIKKWLSYREEELLGRPLSSKEVRHVTATVRRLAALLLLEPKLDANYMAVSEDTYAWPPSEA
ncbi:MAG: DNA methyltransferase, partial [Proteobacteria bacterium]|nr:DNA methyltransferase [Pseudomonadota bacterium]